MQLANALCRYAELACVVNYALLETLDKGQSELLAAIAETKA
jgi:hypothetical protein